MRVTERMIYGSATENIQRARSSVEEAVQESTTGVRVSHPGDDPAAAALITMNKMSGERLEAIRKTTQRAADEMGAAWDALNSLTEVLTRAKEMAVQFSNSSYSAIDRAGAAAEVDGLFKSAIADLNTQMGNRYIFGGNKDDAPPFSPGYATDVPPFSSAGNYVGDTGVRQIEIAPGVVENVSVRADIAVKGVGGGIDILGVLTSLATALRTNSQPGVQAQLTTLDTSLAQIVQANVQASSTVATLETAQSVSMTARDRAQNEVSALGQADMVASATKLALASHALEAALSASAKSFQMSLLDKLG